MPSDYITRYKEYEAKKLAEIEAQEKRDEKAKKQAERWWQETAAMAMAGLMDAGFDRRNVDAFLDDFLTEDSSAIKKMLDLAEECVNEIKAGNNRYQIKVMCAWHPKYHGEELVLVEGRDDRVSHGICPLCAEIMKAETELENQEVSR
jgi:hypothetical protein